jgi:hypothetical protein
VAVQQPGAPKQEGAGANRCEGLRHWRTVTKKRDQYLVLDWCRVVCARAAGHDQRIQERTARHEVVGANVKAATRHHFRSGAHGDHVHVGLASGGQGAAEHLEGTGKIEYFHVVEQQYADEPPRLRHDLYTVAGRGPYDEGSIHGLDPVEEEQDG